jgi:co-chaperonin GroES (HSP10)
MRLFRKPKVSNKSGLAPAGHAVLLQPYEPEIKASLLVIPDMVRRRTAMVEMRAIVVAVGPQAWRQEAKFFGLLPCPRARVGDKVMVSAYCGFIAQGPADGAQYRFVNDEDVFSIITDEDAALAQPVAPVREEAAAALRARAEDRQSVA